MKQDKNSPTVPDLVDRIIAFENGEMNEEQTRQFLIELRDSGLLFQLQGFYGRTAKAMGII